MCEQKTCKFKTHVLRERGKVCIQRLFQNVIALIVAFICVLISKLFSCLPNTNLLSIVSMCKTQAIQKKSKTWPSLFF